MLTLCSCLFHLSAQSGQAQCPNPIRTQIEVRNPVCPGTVQGSVAGRVAGGIPPYSIVLSGRKNAKITISLQESGFVFGSLIEGDYTITITDANGADHPDCIVTESFSIRIPAELVLEATGKPASCSDDTGGSLQGKVSGGTPPYRFLLNGSTVVPDKLTNTGSGTDFDIKGLAPGTYFLRVTDANYAASGNNPGCTVSNTVQLSTANTGGTIETEVDATICAGQTYRLGTRILKQSGTYQETFTSSSGCDSIVTLNLRVEVITNSLERSICEGKSIQFGTQTLTKSGTYREVFTTSSGCDSVVTLKLTVDVIETNLEISICAGESYQFGSQKLTQSGTYRETFTNSIGCDSTVILDLSVGAGESLELTTIPAERTLCSEETIPLKVEIAGGGAPHQIRWYDNPEGTGDPIGNTETILIDPELGTTDYLVEVTNADGCTVSGVSKISFLPIDATIDPIEALVCDAEDGMVIKVTNHDEQQQLAYKWQPENAILSDPEESEVLVDLSAATDFTVLVTNQEGCKATLTSSITTDICDAIMISADHAVVRPGGSASLTVTGCADCAYLWSTGATDSTIVVTPVSTTSYTVSITTSAGCACNALEQTVVVNDCAFNPEDFFVPTAFTPDGDQINDEFCVRSELEIAPDEMVDFLLIIYNRWGQELFRGNSFGDCWDGTFRGTPVAPDVYGYYLQLMCRDEQYSRKGDVMILR